MKIYHRYWRVISHGMTLVELLVVLAISAILLAAAIPALFGVLYANRLRGAADVLLADLRLTMTESSKRGEDVLLSFHHNADNSDWCYGISVDTNCNCHQLNSCQIDGVEHVTRATSYAGILATPTHDSYRFKPRRSTMTAGNITFEAQDGKQLRVLLSSYGRIRTCSPLGNGNISGMSVCP